MTPMAKHYIELEGSRPRDRIVLGNPPRPKPVTGFPDFGHIPLEGSANTRDLGGMPAADGRVIASSRLIRSSSLQHLHPDDAAVLIGEHDLCCVVDFRTDVERDASPDRVELLPEVAVWHLPVFTEETVGITHGNGPLDELKAMREMVSDPFARIRDIYQTALLSDAGRSAYHQFLSLLLEVDGGAILWHCTEGKDRAGLAAYIVEFALGVSEPVRRADYLATNIYARTKPDRFFDSLARRGVMKLFAKEIDAFFYAYDAYLDAALAAVDEEYGSFEAYVTEGLDFSAAQQERLKNRYLV